MIVFFSAETAPISGLLY